MTARRYLCADAEGRYDHHFPPRTVAQAVGLRVFLSVLWVERRLSAK
jgi:hypothetical protein